MTGCAEGPLRGDPVGRKLIYVTGGVDAIFPSQVLEYLYEVARRSFFREITLVCGGSGEVELRRTGGTQPLGVVRFKSLPRYPIADQIVGRHVGEALTRLGVSRECVVHVRGGELGGLLLQVRPQWRRNILVDVRGARREEIREFGSRLGPVRFLKSIGTDLCLRGLRRAEHVSVVSDALRLYVKRLVRGGAEVSVNHTLAGRGFAYDEGLRMSRRAELGVGDEEILVVFSTGGSSGWQETERVVGLLSGMEGIRLLLLARSGEEGKNVVRRFVPYSEVPGYLSAADVGIVLRGRSAVNRVACPIKFSEYLACGLPVVADASVAMIESVVEAWGVGRILATPVSEDELRGALRALRDVDRRKVADVGRRMFGVDVVVSGYLDVYARILSERTGGL